MALTSSKQLCLQLLKNNQKNVLLAIGNQIQNLVPVAQCSSSTDFTKKKISEAMRNYLERTKKYDEFMNQQIEEFKVGKEHLKGIMGINSKDMTQEEIDNAIDYLFPSALYVPRARPMMKPPEEVFSRRAEAAFDYSGRPFHYLFYTSGPKFYETLHYAAKHLQRLDNLQAKFKQPNKTLSILTGNWMSLEELENKFLEKIFIYEYNKFIEVFNKLKNHPFAGEVEDFLKEFWILPAESEEELLPDVVVDPKTKVQTATIETQRKTTKAKITVSYPGTGKILINNMGLDFFESITCREQNLKKSRGLRLPSSPVLLKLRGSSSVKGLMHSASLFETLKDYLKSTSNIL